MDTAQTTTIRVTTAALDIRPAIAYQLRKAGFRGEFRIIKLETVAAVDLYAYDYRATIEMVER